MTIVAIVAAVAVAVLYLWMGSANEKRVADIYRQHFTPEQLEKLGRDPDGRLP